MDIVRVSCETLTVSPRGYRDVGTLSYIALDDTEAVKDALFSSTPRLVPGPILIFRSFSGTSLEDITTGFSRSPNWESEADQVARLTLRSWKKANMFSSTPRLVLGPVLREALA